MTSIFNITTGATHELQLLDEYGFDFLVDVISGSDQHGKWVIEEMPDDCDFAMADNEIGWWERWVRREQRIINAICDMDEEEVNKVPCFYDSYPNWEDAQTEYEKYLGITD